MSIKREIKHSPSRRRNRWSAENGAHTRESSAHESCTGYTRDGKQCALDSMFLIALRRVRRACVCVFKDDCCRSSHWATHTHTANFMVKGTHALVRTQKLLVEQERERERETKRERVAAHAFRTMNQLVHTTANRLLSQQFSFCHRSLLRCDKPTALRQQQRKLPSYPSDARISSYRTHVTLYCITTSSAWIILGKIFHFWRNKWRRKKKKSLSSIGFAIVFMCFWIRSHSLTALGSLGWFQASKYFCDNWMNVCTFVIIFSICTVAQSTLRFHVLD